MIYVDGQPYYGDPPTTAMMSPSPSLKYQSISIDLARRLSTFLKGKPCQVFHAPFDVRLHSDGNDDDTVVQPDLLVICDKTKLNDKGCNGAPDMVIEILSRSTARYDRLLKFNIYQNAGVREYWIVDPESKTVSVYILKDGEYNTKVYGDEDTVNVHILEG